LQFHPKEQKLADDASDSAAKKVARNKYNPFIMA